MTMYSNALCSQAGSGKTYSLGTGLEMNVKDQGIIQRFTNSLFKRMIEYSSKSLGRVSFEISVSYIEVVDNEDVKDLLNEPTNQVVHPFDTTTSAGSDYPSIREDVQGNIVWTGIKVNSVNDVLSFLKKKTQSRTDMMNTPSSSSFIFSIILEQHVENDDTLVENDIPTHLVSKFHFVDLASSQSTLAEGQKALGNVLSALTDESRRKNQHVPYEDSKLTRLLKDSLGGNSHTLMLACVSPDSSDYTETLNTLNYTNRARNRDDQPTCKVTQNDQVKLLKQEMDQLRLSFQEISRELNKVQQERDTLVLKLEEAHQRPIQTLDYENDLDRLKTQINETQQRTFDSVLPSHHHHVLNSDSNTIIVSSKTLDNRKVVSSSSSSKRLNSKKRPVVHRMKSTHSSSLLTKKKHHQNMDELLELLRQEYLLAEEGGSRDINEKSIDETVLQESHDDNIMTMQHFGHTSPSFSCGTENKKIMPDTSILDEDELEALVNIIILLLLFNNTDRFIFYLYIKSVPSWSDAPKSINGSAKRKSISLDSMWDDTDSSITTSRMLSTTTQCVKPTATSHSKSKDVKRQSRNLLKMLHQIQADLLVKRELVGQLERSEDQYSQMKINYEERLNELKGHLFEIQHQRDVALKKNGTTIVPAAGKTTTTVLQLRENKQAQEVRSQYEVKLKRLVTENQELRKKYTQSTQLIQTSRAKAEGIIGRLRADIEGLKMDKKQLNKGIKMETDKSREIITNYQQKIQHLKRRELVALDQKKKIEQVYEAQNQVLKKRTEETAAVNLQIRQLTNALRRAANEGTFLNEVSLERLFTDAHGPVASPKNNMRRPSSRILGNSSVTSV
ncbi:hypothetical protein INT48_006815, partial [Thamnidium elegans]